MEFRIEKDTMGDVKVPANKLWGAQTERSRNNFKIGAAASMPLEVVYGFAYLKKAAAFTFNCSSLRRNFRRQTRRPISISNLANRFRNTV